jgi:hypothetical protein
MVKEIIPLLLKKMQNMQEQIDTLTVQLETHKNNQTIV